MRALARREANATLLTECLRQHCCDLEEGKAGQELSKQAGCLAQALLTERSTANHPGPVVPKFRYWNSELRTVEGLANEACDHHIVGKNGMGHAKGEGNEVPLHHYPQLSCLRSGGWQRLRKGQETHSSYAVM